MNQYLNVGAVRSIAGALLLAGIAASGAVHAQDAEPAVKVTGSAAFVSDYRFRGISFSDLDPAPQAFIQLTTKQGFFVSAWGSSISDYLGSTTEIDITGGWTGALGPVNTTLGVIGYLYPGSSNTSVVEFFGTASIPAGPVTLTAGLNWAPDQKNLSRANRYIFGTVAAAIPNTPITLKATLGNERGSLVVDETGVNTSKWDWLVGADITFAPITVGIAYVDTDLPRTTIDFGEGDVYRANRTAKGGVVVSVTAAF